jgi:hypothetical protein
VAHAQVGAISRRPSPRSPIRVARAARERRPGEVSRTRQRSSKNRRRAGGLRRREKRGAFQSEWKVGRRRRLSEVFGQSYAERDGSRARVFSGEPAGQAATVGGSRVRRREVRSLSIASRSVTTARMRRLPPHRAHERRSTSKVRRSSERQSIRHDVA